MQRTATGGAGRIAIAVIGAMLVVLGGAGALAWLAGRSQSMLLGQPLAFNAALGLLLTGLAHLLHAARWRLTAVVAVLPPLLLGALTMVQLLLGLNLGVDNLLLGRILPLAGGGGMALAAACCFILSSLAFLTLLRRPAVAGVLGSLTFAAGAVSLLGYAMGVDPAMGYGNVVGMSSAAALGFLLDGLALNLCAWHADRGTLRRGSWLGFSVFMALATMTVALWMGFRSVDDGKLKEQTELVQDMLVNDVREAIAVRVGTLSRMERYWELRGSLTEAEWRMGARLDVTGSNGVTSMAWLSPDLAIKWVEPIEVQSEFRAIHPGSSPEPKAAIRQALATREPQITSPMRLASGGRGIIAYVPIFSRNVLTGVLGASIETATGLTPLVRGDVRDDFGVGIYSLRHGRELVFENGIPAPEGDTKFILTRRLQLYGDTWLVVTWPSAATLAGAMPPLQFAILAGGFLLSMLAWLMVVLAMRARWQRIEAEAANHQLSGEIALRAHAEAEAKRLAAIVASSEDAIMSLAADGTVATWNRGAVRLFGYSASAAVGSPFVRLFAPDRQGQIENALAEVRRGEHVTHLEVPTLAVDRPHSIVSLSLSPVVGAQGRAFAVAATARDVTERKRVETELVRAMEAADGANRAKSAFVATMSHEIRTPLGVILGYAEMLLDASLGTRQRQQHIETILRSGRNLLAIINDVLDLSKVESGRLEVETARFRLAPFIQDLLSALRVKAVEKQIDLRLVATAPLPETIETDEAKLRQILINIISNAIKFTNHGSVAVRVELEAGQLAIDVEDTGAGIETLNQARIFEPFTQADSSISRRFGGTGLGLSLARHLARALRGDVLLMRSELGKGSVFRVTVDPGELGSVPLIRPELLLDSVLAPVPERHAATASDAAVRLSGIRLLLVEDFEENQRLMAHHLRRAGAEVEIAQNGVEAVAKAALAPYDLVFMDIQMPIIDGYEATALLRAGGFTAPIVALTAHAMKGERERCERAGCTDYLTKPVSRETLLRTAEHRGRSGLGPPPGSALPALSPEPAAIGSMPPGRSQAFAAGLPAWLAEAESALAADDWQALLALARQLKAAEGGLAYPLVTVLASAFESVVLQTKDGGLASLVLAALRLTAERARQPVVMRGGRLPAAQREGEALQ